ncbi:MAG: gluconokinase [Gemmatimonadaceae bacterium]
MDHNLYVVMGITGCGKSTVGEMLARKLGVDFIEGDDYHSRENVARMASGIPLTDDDRSDWLCALANRIRVAKDAGAGVVLACSALRRSYRDVLRSAAPHVQFIFLKGSRSLIAKRIATRQDHFMPPSLIESQLTTLEEPTPDERAWLYEIEWPAEDIVVDIVARASV